MTKMNTGLRNLKKKQTIIIKMPSPKWMVLTYQLLATNLSLATPLYSHAFTLYCIVLAIVFFLKCLRFVWTSLRVQHTSVGIFVPGIRPALILMFCTLCSTLQSAAQQKIQQSQLLPSNAIQIWTSDELSPMYTKQTKRQKRKTLQDLYYLQHDLRIANLKKR